MDDRPAVGCLPVGGLGHQATTHDLVASTDIDLIDPVGYACELVEVVSALGPPYPLDLASAKPRSLEVIDESTGCKLRSARYFQCVLH